MLICGQYKYKDKRLRRDRQTDKRMNVLHTTGITIRGGSEITHELTISIT